MNPPLQIAYEIFLSLLLLVGAFFVLLGGFSLVRLSEFFKRLHGPTKASTLGVGCVLAASVGYHAFIGSDPQPRELLIIAFLFVLTVVAFLVSGVVSRCLCLRRPSRVTVLMSCVRCGR